MQTDIYQEASIFCYRDAALFTTARKWMSIDRQMDNEYVIDDKQTERDSDRDIIKFYSAEL